MTKIIIVLKELKVDMKKFFLLHGLCLIPSAIVMIADILFPSTINLIIDKGIVIEEAVMGVMFFNATMCIGRLLGNRLGKHLTSKQVVISGYLLGSVAMALVVLLPGYGSMYTYLLVGISLAMVVPNN